MGNNQLGGPAPGMGAFNEVSNEGFPMARPKPDVSLVKTFVGTQDVEMAQEGVGCAVGQQHMGFWGLGVDVALGGFGGVGDQTRVVQGGTTGESLCPYFRH